MSTGISLISAKPMEVLLRCLRGGVSSEFVRALPGRLNWGEVLRLADRFDTVPLVYMNLAKTGALRFLPADCLRDLTTAYIRNSARSIRLRGELKRQAARLSGAGVPVILLKGAALAATVYDDFTLRPMGDIDLLVERRNLDRARECLLTAGYRSDPSDQSAAWYRANHHHDQPVHSVDNHVTIELHFDIVPPNHSFQLPLDELWSRALPVNIGDCSALVLSPEDLIIHSCVHLGSVHGMTGQLKGLVDIAAIIRRFQYRFRWPLLVDLAVRYGAVADVYHALLLARRYAGAEVPAESLRELRAPLPCGEFERRLATRVFRHAVLGHGEGWVPTGLIQAACRILLTRARLRQKLQAAARFVWTRHKSDVRAKCGITPALTSAPAPAPPR